MKIFVGLKKRDLETVSEALNNKVKYIIWPDVHTEKSNIIHETLKGTPLSNACYIHYSGYHKLSCIELEMFGNRCINIHPAPPKYPGVGGLNFALYNNEEFFGVTVHLMNEHLDDGKILDVIPLFIGEYKSLQEAMRDLTNLRLTVLDRIVKNITDSEFDDYINTYADQKISWSRKMWTRKELDHMQIFKIDQTLNEYELKRRIRAFQTADFPIQIHLEKRTFLLIETKK